MSTAAFTGPSSNFSQNQPADLDSPLGLHLSEIIFIILLFKISVKRKSKNEERL